MPSKYPIPEGYKGPANTTRAQSRVFAAFVTLVQSTRYDEIRVADLISAADVGRSTFYDHFRDKDDVLRQSLKAPLASVADAAVGMPDEAKLVWSLAHFWERRALARIILAHPTRDVVAAALNELILDRSSKVGDPDKDVEVIATMRAHGLVAFLAGWVVGRPAMTPEQAAKAVRAACPPLV
ncbi:MAG: TetR/AcrR family transcriptional regulator [Pseudomonadota bacterium]